MNWAAAGITALKLGSGAASFFGNKNADKAAEQAARDQAKYTYSQRMEELRRIQREDALIRGQAIAGSYASNIQASSGSPARYLEDLQAEQRRQQAYKKWAAGKEKDLIERGGQVQGGTMRDIGGAASTIADAFTTYRSLAG